MHLLIGVYNHTLYQAFSNEEADMARNFARGLFGYELAGQDYAPDKSLDEQFTHLGAFPYDETLETISNPLVLEARRATGLFGWYAVLSDAQKDALEALTFDEAGTEKLFKDTHFFQLFNIVYVPLGTELPLVIDVSLEQLADWPTTGRMVYRAQTPAMWRQ